MTDIVKLALDAHKGKIAGNFSKDDSMEVLRQELVAANNGETSLNYKSIRDGKCNGLFAIIEAIIDKAIVDGIQDDHFFTQLVDFRNLAMGDQMDFYAPQNSLLVVSEISEGNLGIRRQRPMGGEQIRVTPTVKAIRIYEEMNRLLAGRVDMNKFIDIVGRSFKAQMYTEIADHLTTAFGMANPLLRTSGTYDRQAVLRVIQNLEDATGRDAIIVGTKTGLAALADDLMSDSQREQMFNTGYIGKYFGTPVVGIKTVFRNGVFGVPVLPDYQIMIVTAESKPVKYVTEGESTILLGNPTDNADLTQEYICMNKTGSALMISDAIGFCEFA